ncbi:FAD-binding domain-containing protein [Penicillium sp. IBT 35674x]|nr:FAD-binding domain-containing protein [Penicillium sp. IBT 35674x]
MDRLLQFLAEHPRIKYATPTCPEFGSWCPGSIVKENCTPGIIVRPRSAEDVAGLISVLAANNVAFSVRVGGHDMFGRSQIHGGITIDLRTMVLIQPVWAVVYWLRRKNDLVTPHGLIPSVGYVGWATHGGYGLLSAQYGLGVDQILEARVVDCQGRICDADKDMLTAIRGGGGSIGVIVEVTIRVYPLGQVLAGVIIYESNDLGATIERYNSTYSQFTRDGLPPPSAFISLL